MPSIKKIRTTSADKTFTIETDDQGGVVLEVYGSEGAVLGKLLVDETLLLEVALEYFHERGLRRQRQPRQEKAVKPRKARKARAVNGGAEETSDVSGVVNVGTEPLRAV